MKNRFIKLLIILCIVILGVIVYKIFDLSDYLGEYYIETPKTVNKYVHEQYMLTEPNIQKYDDFFGTFLFSYEEYVKFCKKYDLMPRYKDESEKYIVYTAYLSGWISECVVKRVKIKEGKAEVYLELEVTGASTADVTCMLLCIPVDSSVEGVSVIEDKSYVSSL